MPHNNLNKHVRLSETTEFSAEIGVTYEDSRETLLGTPSYPDLVKYDADVSPVPFFFIRPLIPMNIDRLPYTSDCMARKSILPVMPQQIRIRADTDKEAGNISSAVGTAMGVLICTIPTPNPPPAGTLCW